MGSVTVTVAPARYDGPAVQVRKNATVPTLAPLRLRVLDAVVPLRVPLSWRVKARWQFGVPVGVHVAGS
jgi:hypothetical protein